MIGEDWKEENILEVPKNSSLVFIDYKVPNDYVLFIDEIILRIDKLCQAILNIDNNIRRHPNLIRDLPIRVNQSAYPPIVCTQFVKVIIYNTDPTKDRWNEAYLGGKLYYINQQTREEVEKAIPTEELKEEEFEIEEIFE
ncbi:MAG: hypothetical protein ABIK75_07380 [candidate division WOR-3 bacterium]